MLGGGLGVRGVGNVRVVIVLVLDRGCKTV